MLSNKLKIHFPEVDYLRAVAILLVLFRHTHYCFPAFISDYPIYLQGTWSGVDLFFVISGFVITLSLLPSSQKVHIGSLSFKKYVSSFFVRRIFRLIPIALFSLGVYLFLGYAFNTSGQFGKFSELQQEVLPILFYYHNYYIWSGGSTNMSWYWSLSIEEQFYFVYPFVLVLIPSRKVQFILFGFLILLITFVLRPFTTPSFESVDFKLWPLFTTPSHLRFDALFAGCLTALIHLKYSDRFKKWISNNLILSRIIVLLCLFGVATFGAILPNFQLTGYPTIVLCSSTLVLIAASNKHLIPTLGVPKVFNWIGKRSYSIYLFHMIAIRSVNEFWFRMYGMEEAELSNTQGAIGLFSALLLTVIIVEILFRLLETKSIKIGQNISNRILSE
jgi:peptidoglycan/LPS O-acetylase OafA/YrhL